MKKIYLFGILGLFAMAIATAGLVSYLSNTAQAEIQVDSPMSVGFINVNGNAVDSLILPDTTGLSTFNFEFEVSNLANNEIIAPNLVFTVDNGKWTTTCDDLASIKFTDTWCHGEEASVDCPEQELAGIGLCDDSTGKAVYTIPTVKYKVDQTTNYPVSATWDNVEPATYTITAQMNI